jgi:DNA-binding LytR/AlgR family response regulator
VLFFQSYEKYTRVVTAHDEAHIRKPLKEIADGLDPEDFWQVHRGLMVRATAMPGPSATSWAASRCT